MKAKPIIVIIATLIIGFVLGMLTSAQIRLQKLRPVRVFFSEERFREGFYNAIGPDEKQKARIDIILDKYAKINGNLQSNFRKEFDSNIKEFRTEIDSTLTKEQLVRLKEFDERRQEMIHQNRRQHGVDSLNVRDNWNHPDRRQPGNRPPPPALEASDSNRLHSNK